MAYESVGRGFESRGAHHPYQRLTRIGFTFGRSHVLPADSRASRPCRPRLGPDSGSAFRIR